MLKQPAESQPLNRRVHLFRNGRNQAIRIPKEFEFPGEEVLLRREGDSLIIEPLGSSGLLKTLMALKPLKDSFPDVDEGLGELDTPQIWLTIRTWAFVICSIRTSSRT
jgi:antitoxin VapB